MNQLSHTSPLKSDYNGLKVPIYGTPNKILYYILGGSKHVVSFVLACAFLFTPFVSIFSQSNTCVPGMVMNANGDPWSEECYLDDNCMEQGNPCQANDVQLIGVFIADAMGGPVPACTIGDSVDVLLWGTFTNGTGTNRYAVRSNTEIFIDGNFHVELNACSFDVLPAGTSDVALIGQFSYVCGQQVSITNTWVAWSTSVAQCSNPVGANYNDVCNEYSPSKCSKDFDEIVFLTPNFSYTCGDTTSAITTEVCFNNLTFGGAPPLEYFWEFGDGDTSVLENPCHTYNATTGVFIVTLTVTDSNGVQAGVQLTIDLDSLVCCNLTIICPDENGGTFSCIEDVPDPDPDLITVVDSCGPVTITSSDQVSGTGCGSDTMFITRTYVVADSVNTDSCTQTFKVVDDEAPVIVTCVADVTVACGILVPDADITLIVASDNCSGMVTITAGADVITSQTCADRYIITRTYIATDTCGNSSSCQQTITVFDDIPPTFTFVPGDTTIACNTTPVFGTPIATDNCGGVPTITSTDSSAIAANCAGGTVTRTWTATDSCGNTATASQTLTFIDTIPPAFTFVPADSTIACDSPAVFGTPIVTDNCDMSVNIDSTTTTNPAANCAGGTTTRVWTATDDCGNTATASQVITFIDTVAPVFTFIPVDATIECTDMPAFGTPTATDNCDTDVAITSTTTADTLLNCAGGSTTRTWTATDNCGNTATASQTLTFVDSTPPDITCPGDVTVECASLVPAANILAVITSDNCGGVVTVTVAADIISGLTCPNRYLITRVYTATDACLNTAMCTQLITVFDDTPPSITCPPDITVQCSDDVPPADVSTVVASDNCGGTPTVTVAADVITAQTCANRYIITRVYTATDSCGNIATCTQIINVFDSTAPAITCPPDVIVDCEDSTLPPGTGTATATDNCGGMPVVDFSDVTVAGVCPQEFNVTRTWTATDECGNSTACVQMIMVQDTTPPTFNPACQAEFEFFTSGGSDCPADATVSLEVGDIIGEAETWIVGGNEIPGLNGCLFDNCGDPDSLEARVDSIIVTGDNCSSVITIYFTILNDCDSLNVNLFINVVTIVDDLPPAITCPADVTIDCEESTSPDNTGLATATDNCQLAGITFTDSIAPGPCPQEMMIFRTWTADDSCGNVSTCLQNITVQDTTPPTFEVECQLTLDFFTSDTSDCPAAATISLIVGDTISADETWTVGGNTIPSLSGCLFDNCTDPDSLVARVDSIAIEGDTCTRSFNVFFTIIDQCGNASVMQFVHMFTITDDVAPVITCPADLTIDCGESTIPDSTGIATAVDDCQANVGISYTESITPGACPQEFTISRTWFADDSCGNISSCVQTISVQDTVPPVFDTTLCETEFDFYTSLGSTCPQESTPSIFINIAQGIPLGINETWTVGNNVIPAFAGCLSDNCGNPDSILIQASSLITSGDSCMITFTVEFNLTDECGNVELVTFIIRVHDDTPPVITCPADITIDCEESTSPDSTGIATAIDDCQLGIGITSTDSIATGMCPQEMIIFRTWVADDSCGNVSSCLQTITVQDTTPPTFNPECQLVFDFFTSDTSDCPAASLTSLEPGQIIGESETWTAGGNTILSFDGCLFDNCTDPDSLVARVDDVLITGDSCVRTFTVFFTIIDQCANESVTQLVSVINIHDNVAPVITCPADVTIDCEESTSPDSTGIATAVDDCQLEIAITSTDSIVPGLCPQEMTIFRTWVADDSCGNVSSCLQTITVQDTTPPVATFIPPDITIECDENIDSVLAEVPIFMDNCDPDVPALGSIEVIFNELCPQGPTLIIAWSGVDDCGNSTTVGRTVVVIDTTGPVITCPADVTIECTDDTSTETNGFATATDNCDPLPAVDFSDSIVEGECPQEYTINRTWIATDACGNSNTCLQTIFVIDTTPPVMTCPANLSVECAESVPPADTASVTATDNCGIPVIAHVGDFTSDSSCVNRLTVTRIYQATDECGNSSTCEQIITVFDDTPPTIITCPANVTVQCASQVPPVNIAAVSATDNCNGTPVITHDGDVISNMTCINRFIVTRTYRATDECGNTATCAQIITVFDNTPPSITCPANVTVQCASQVPPVNTGSVTASDNCAGMTTITHVGDVITNMTCVNRFILTRTYRATDECGNSATCSQVITVFDNTPPTITCPANVTVQCASDVPPVNVGSVITADNCAGTVTVTHVSDVVTNMSCLNRFTLTRTYRATDACGNSATCTQVITVFDDTPPVITFSDPLLEGVPNGGTVEVQCFGQDPEWELPTFNAGSVSVTDNCAGTVTVAFTDVLVDEGDCEVDGYINLYRLTWIATDVCGNSSSAFVFLALIDTIPPVIHGIPADTTVNCDEIPEPPAGIFATDECLCACVILYEQSDPAPGCQDGQVITRTWTAEDDCGNVTVEVQNITLIDNEGPELILMQPELAGVEDGAVLQYTCNEGGIPDFFDELSAESINSPVSCGTSGIISFNERTIFANNCKFWGYIESRTYTWEGIDQCGNISTLTITAQVIDTEPPVIVGVPDTTCIDDPSLDEIEVVDNCDNASLTYWDVTIENPCGDEPAIMRTYEAYDDCGNYVRDTAILLPNDFSHPVMEFVDPVLAALEFGEILIVECNLENGQYTPYGPGDVDFIDACMTGVNINFTETVIESGDCSDGVVAVVQLSWTATDVCGNLSEALITAHIVDNTSPEFVNFETEITIDCGDEMPEVFATDNCGEVTITTTDDIIPGLCEFEYDVMRTHTATDPCGNMAVRRQLIHVGDGSGPEIEGVIEEVCDDLSIPEVTAYDPCADQFVEVTMVQDTLDVPCNDGIVIERIWTAVDACGHVSEVRQLIVLGDQTPPEIQVPTYSIIRRFDGHLFNFVFLSQTGIMEQLNELNAGSVFVLDDCDQEIEAEFTLVTVYSDNCEEDGYFERRTYSWVATDVCGNSDVISFTVDIRDDIPPVLEGVPANETIICDGLPPVPVVTASDPAQPVTIEYVEVIETGDGPGQFVAFRTWTATDACGNSTQATQTITWIPDSFLDCSVLLPGGVECNSHGVVIGSDLFGGIGDVTYLWEVIGEKCFIQSGQGTPEIIIYVGWSDVQISLTVTDAFGCSSVCSATLSCIDPLDPLVITGSQILTPDNAVDHAVPSADDVDYTVLHHFNLWPNPANASVNLSFESSLDHEVQFTLTNYLGQVVLNNKITAVKGFNSRKIDVSSLPDGSYLMQLISEKETRTKMLVLFRQ